MIAYKCVKKVGSDYYGCKDYKFAQHSVAPDEFGFCCLRSYSECLDLLQSYNTESLTYNTILEIEVTKTTVKTASTHKNTIQALEFTIIKEVYNLCV